MIGAVIVSAILLIVAGFIGFALSRHLRAAGPETLRYWSFWTYAGLLILLIAMSWFGFFTGLPDWLIVIYIAAGTVYALYALASVTNWHGWGRRLWEFRLWKPRRFPPYRRPRDPRLVLTVLIAAPLALLSDLVLLILIVMR